MEKLYNILIVKYGEIGVKGKNRYIFENKLIKNVKNMTNSPHQKARK